MGLIRFTFWHCCSFGQVPFAIGKSLLLQMSLHLPLIQIWLVAQSSCSKQISGEFAGLIFKQLWPIFEHLFLPLQGVRHFPFIQTWFLLQSLLSWQLGTQPPSRVGAFNPLLLKNSSLIFDWWHFYIISNQKVLPFAIFTIKAVRGFLARK